MRHSRWTSLQRNFFAALGRATLLLWALVCAVVAGGCAEPSSCPDCQHGHAPAGEETFVTGEPLREGDILLGRSYGLMGAAFARYGAVPGSYSHGAVFYRDENGAGRVLNFRPHGMESCTPAEYFSRYNKLALVRCTALDDGAGVSASCRRWLQLNAENRILPDFSLDKSSPEELYCLELVSRVYRENSLPDPFAHAKCIRDFPAADAVCRELQVNLAEIPSPNAVLAEPGFAVLSSWEHPEYDKRNDVLNETILAALVDYKTEGRRIRAPRLGGRMHIALILAVFRIRQIFHRGGATIPASIDRYSIDNGYMYYQHVSRSKRLAKRWFRARLDDDANNDAARRLARQACDTYRDHYFAAPDPTAQLPEQQSEVAGAHATRTE